MELLFYFLKVSACKVMFFAFYLLVLRRLTFFKINRFYLLITLMISFIIPNLHFTVEREIIQEEIINSPIVLPDTEISEVGYQTPIIVGKEPMLQEAFDYYSLLPYLYLVTVIILLLFASWRLFQLLRHTRNSVEKINGLKIVSKTKGFTNCSFFNYVFIDEGSLTQEELGVLLKHEEVHAKQLHSIDKIIMMVIKAVLWFNPVIYLYDKALEQAHEYEADEATSQSFGTSEYASLLLRLAVSKSEMGLVHNFVKSPIKERIKMLFNSKSKQMKKLMYLLALPIGLGLLWGFTVDVVEVSSKSEATEKGNIAEHDLKEKPIINNTLWNKIIRGKVKSILQTEVGEVLNFKYDKGVIRVFNSAKGKVSVGDEVFLTINGTVEAIQVKDAKGNIIKELDAPCYSMKLIKTLAGKVLFDLENNNKPFLYKSVIMHYGNYKSEKFTLNTFSGKTLSVKIIHQPETDEASNIYIYIDGKLYSEKETLKFDKNFIAKLSVKRGFSKSSDFDIPAIRNKENTYVFWFGNEPKLSANAAKNRDIYQKYNGATVEGKVIGFTISPTTKMIDGFLIKTNDGETLKANVETKFAKQTQSMISKNDMVSIKIYNSAYWKDSTYPVLTSYKISKNGRLLYDKWPKTVSNNVSQVEGKTSIVQNKMPNKPILKSASSFTVDSKNNITYIRNGVMEIGGVRLEAKESTLDNTKNTIKATKATITKNGHMIVSDEILIDVNANYFRVKEIKEPFRISTFSKIEPEYLVVGDAKKVKHYAKDSTRIDKINQVIYLYGNATIAKEKMKFKGTEIAYNAKLNTATVKNATYYDNEASVTADIMEVDFNTSKVISKKGDLKMTWK